MPEILADQNFVCDSSSTFDRSVPLEDVDIPYWPDRLPIIQPLRLQMSKPLIELLIERPLGARRPLMSMLRVVLRCRLGQLRSGETGSASTSVHPIFGVLPQDYGHFGTNYLRHLLNPLVDKVPPAIESALTGENSSIVDEFKDLGISGLVVINLEDD